jgi:uncharacterized protein (DUF305 family)
MKMRLLGSLLSGSPIQPLKTHMEQSSLFFTLLRYALCVFIGLGLGWFIGTRVPSENGAEVRFARDMSAHHEQAVEMALTIRERTTDTELRQFTLDMLLTQQAQIGQMQGWLAVWGQPLAGAEPPMAGHGSMMGMASQEELNSLRELPVADAEAQFMRLMIRHHEGGIMMAQEALATTRQPQVVRLAQSIIAGQQSETAYMREWLTSRGFEAPAPMPAMDHK